MDNRKDCICPPLKMHIGTTDTVNMSLEKTNGVNFSLGDKCCSVPSYNVLPDKPKINGVTLQGNKTDDELYLQHVMDEITEQDIDRIIYG